MEVVKTKLTGKCQYNNNKDIVNASVTSVASE